MELEQLNADELLEVRSNLGIYQAYVQLKRFTYEIYGSLAEIHIYRLVLLTEDD